MRNLPTVRTRIASAQDAPELNRMLASLSDHLKDTHRASDGSIEHAIGSGLVHAVIAEQQNAIGTALFSPVFSTTQGSFGAYVSDLWVDERYRDQGVGSAIIDAVLARSAEMWDGRFVSLSVYDTNTNAQRFYASRGFTEKGRLFVWETQRQS